MSDFFQTGNIATLHRLGSPEPARIERELAEFCAETPVALVLPCHVRDLHSPALRRIVAGLREVRYLRQIVVGLDGAMRASDSAAARRLFSRLPAQTLFVRNEGARMRRIHKRINAAGLATGKPGKGRNVWLCIGCVLAFDEARAIAVHDCDVITYGRGMLARLVYPVAHPNLGFDFCKGYYPRFTDRLNGRVMRLFLTPVLRALREMLGPHPLLVYFDSFRYPLAGEFAIHTDLARRVRMPSDWALEIGLLAEVFRNSAPRAICQSDLCENYDHKHQELSLRDPRKGLNRMASDIARSLFRRIAAEGVKLDAGLFDSLQSAYLRHAEETLRCYSADAAINGLVFSRHDEEAAVGMFAKCIRTAGRAFVADPLTSPMIPGWNRVQSAIPEIFAELRAALEADNGI